MYYESSKTCSVCKQTKSIDLFPYDASALDGHLHRCKECHNRINRAYRRTEKGRNSAIESARRWREANKARNLSARLESSGTA